MVLNSQKIHLMVYNSDTTLWSVCGVKHMFGARKMLSLYQSIKVYELMPSWLHTDELSSTIPTGY